MSDLSQELRDLRPETPILTILDRCLRAADEIERLCTERDEALRYATAFLESYVRKYCNPIPEWKPLPELIGVLTQIDNSSTVTGELQSQLVSAKEIIRRVIAEYGDDHYLTCPKDTMPETGQCDCFGGILMADVKATYAALTDDLGGEGK